MHNDTKVQWALCDECGDEYDMAAPGFILFNDGICRCGPCQDKFEDCPDCGSTYPIAGHCECEYCARCSDILGDGDGHDGLCGYCADKMRCEDCGDWINDGGAEGDDGPGQCLLCRKQAAGRAAVAATGQVTLQLILGGKGRKPS